jgi:hypothetical protein
MASELGAVGAGGGSFFVVGGGGGGMKSLGLLKFQTYEFERF